MASFPSVETLSVIAGIGGWAGTYYAANLYLDGTQLTPAKLLTLASMPLLWSSLGIVVLAGGICTLKATLFLYSAMFQPIPFAINLLAIAGLTSWVVISKNIQHMIYRTVAEEAEQEQRVDLRIPASPPNEAVEADEDATTETQTEAEEEEESEEDEEAEEDEGSEGEQDDSEVEREQDDSETEVSTQSPSTESTPEAPAAPDLPDVQPALELPMAPVAPEVETTPAASQNDDEAAPVVVEA